jgi:hypothetical protein
MTSTAPTDLDFVAAILVFIILTVSILTLFGMGILMAAGAIFSNRPLVTSWTPDKEASFATYERRGAMSNSQAWLFSLVGAVVVAIFVTGVYFGVTPERKDVTKDMNMSNLTKKHAAGAAAKPDSAAPAEAPKADTPAPAAAPKADTPAPAAPKQ